MSEKNKKMFSWMSPKLEIRETGKYGKETLPEIKNGKKIYKKKGEISKGVFAIEDIKKDDVLFVMGGYILTIEDDNSLRGVVADKPIEISDKFSIGPLKPSDIPLMPQHYINHSCNPNVGFQGQIFIVAMRKIKKGEEIVYDYAMVMNSNKDSNSYFTMKCLCGSKYCRGDIAEDDWKIPDLQKKYDGYFQYFLQKKINK